MAIASIIVSVAGIVLGFLLGFPLSMLVGPFVGIVFGIVGLVLGIFAFKAKRTKVSVAALIIGIAVPAISIIRVMTLASCVGGLISLFAG